MPTERARRILEWLEAERTELTEFLAQLIQAESPSSLPESQEAIQRLLSRELCDLGFRLRCIRGSSTGGHLLCVPRERTRRAPAQVIIGHTDTVWPLGTLDSMPLVCENGRIKGPGAFDMKGGLAQLVWAFRALSALELRPTVTPVVFLNSDEEVGSPESGRHVVRLARLADRVLVLEPALGRKGKLKTARKGAGQFTLRVTGRAAHAGLEPGRGVSAILELSHLVQRLFELNEPHEGISVNVGTIGGGLRPNVVAPFGELAVDIRVMTREQAERVEREIRRLKPVNAAARLVVEGGIEKPPLERTPRNRALWRLAKRLGGELDLELEEGTSGGASDGNLASLYAPTLDGLGAVGGGAHAVHEFVQWEALTRRAALLALLLLAPPVAWRDETD